MQAAWQLTGACALAVAALVACGGGGGNPGTCHGSPGVCAEGQDSTVAAPATNGTATTGNTGTSTTNSSTTTTTNTAPNVPSPAPGNGY